MEAINFTNYDETFIEYLTSLQVAIIRKYIICHNEKELLKPFTFRPVNYLLSFRHALVFYHEYPNIN